MVQSQQCVSVGSPYHSGCDLCAEKDAQVADGVGGEHADDGEGNGEVPIQRIRALYTHTQQETYACQFARCRTHILYTLNTVFSFMASECTITMI